MALQEVGLDKLMTAREMLVLQARLFSADRTAARAVAERLLSTVGLDDVDPKKRVGQFSGGMKRRLDLALALVNDPEILFLDEPTTGLDPVSRLAIWEEVRRLNRERGMTIFLTTQYLEEADKLADEVAIIDRGKIVAQGAPRALKREIGNEVVTLTFASAETAERAAEALRELAPSQRLRDVSSSVTSRPPPTGCPGWCGPSTKRDRSGGPYPERAHPGRRVSARHRPAHGRRRGGAGMTDVSLGGSTDDRHPAPHLSFAAQQPAHAGGAIPNIAISVFFLFVFNAGLSSVAELPGFKGSYLAFIIPVSIVSASVGGAGTAGQMLVRDIESGYFTKLLLTPASRLALVWGPMVAGAVLLVAQVVLILALGIAMGLRSASGPAGLARDSVFAFLWGMAFAGYAVFMALKTKNGAAAQKRPPSPSSP